MNPLDTYFVNQSHNPGKLTFVNLPFWEKRTAIHKPRRPFNFDLKTYALRTILREVSRVSSLILRAKLWLDKKVLRHGKSFCRSGSQTLGNLSTRRFLRGDGNRKSNLLPIHVSRWQSRPSRLCADFVLLILTSPVKREFCFYDFRAFISFCLRCFALSDT